MTEKDSMAYSASDVMQLLNLGRGTTYRYIEEVYQNGQPFPVIKIRGRYRIPKKAFDHWLNGC